MTYKKSEYNFIIQRNNSGNILLSNLYSLSSSWIDEKLYKSLEQNLISNDTMDIEKMLKYHFIVPSNIDEFSKVKEIRRKAIENVNQKQMTFLIAPTLNCNYNCLYCFEHNIHEKKSMTLNEAELVADFIVKMVKGNNECEKLHIIFFGGEPTLSLDVILKIGSYLKNITKKLNIIFDSSIISNGYKLSNQNVLLLNSTCNLTEAQITIDGNQEYYSYIKKVPKTYFNQVVKNIVDICELINVKVRVNVSHSNEIDAIKLFKSLLIDHELNGKIKIYPSPILKYNNGNTYDHYSYFDYMRFCDQLISCSNNMDINYMKSRICAKLKRTYCRSLNRKYMCIGPDLLLYRCEHYIGRKEYSIGDIETGYRCHNDIDKYFLNDLPTKCYSCKFNMICQGGCQANRFLENIEPECEYMDDIVRWRLLHLIKQKREQTALKYNL